MLHVPTPTQRVVGARERQVSKDLEVDRDIMQELVRLELDDLNRESKEVVTDVKLVLRQLGRCVGAGRCHRSLRAYLCARVQMAGGG